MRNRTVRIKVQPQASVDLFQNEEAIRQLNRQADDLEKLAETFDRPFTRSDILTRSMELRRKAYRIQKESEDVVAAHNASTRS